MKLLASTLSEIRTDAALKVVVSKLQDEQWAIHGDEDYDDVEHREELAKFWRTYP